MMHLKSNKGNVADIQDFSGFITTRQSGIVSLTKIVVAISVLLALLMVISK